MENKILYKYRSLESFDRFAEILFLEQMYAGVYTEMNDPMEGIYWANADIPEVVTNVIRSTKIALRFCCFSKRYDIGLQWAYYSDSLKGVVLGVELDGEYEKIDIDYVNDRPSITDFTDPQKAAKKIFRYKLKAWQHEDEVRVFAHHDSKYIKVKIREIYIGPKTSQNHEELIRSMVAAVARRNGNQSILVQKVVENDLDYPWPSV